MRLATAIKWLKQNYEYACRNDYVRDKIAWSLYQTWQQVERIKSDQAYREARKKVKKKI